MAGSSKWKSKLVSSSLPLEFEVARFLVYQGFYVNADYTYARDDSGIVKDFSVDIRATAYTPFSNPNNITTIIDLLIECKQRNPNVKWLFFPDPNRKDFSSIESGRTIRAIDKFSKKFFRSDATSDFDEQAPHCYKGMEVDESDGRVYDSELKHGIAQLQYAIPRLLTETALFNVYGHPDDNVPFLICPILLTTAEILVTQRNLTTKMVESASKLADIAKPVPYLVLYADCGPDFEKHCIRECTQLAELQQEDFEDIETYRKANGEYSFYLPSSICKGLAEGRRFSLKDYFTQFVVCQMSKFDVLVSAIKKQVSSAGRKLRDSREA